MLNTISPEDWQYETKNYESSIYSVEVTATDLVMNIITNHQSSKIIIYSDSKSVLLALQNQDTSTPIITILLNKMNTLSKQHGIILTWMPNHNGKNGNERTKLPKKALLADISNIKILYNNLKPTINKFTHNY